MNDHPTDGDLVRQLTSDPGSAAAGVAKMRQGKLRPPPDLNWSLILERLETNVGRALRDGPRDQAIAWTKVLQEVRAVVEEGAPGSAPYRQKYRDAEARIYIALVEEAGGSEPAGVTPVDLEAWVVESLPMSLDEAKDFVTRWERRSPDSRGEGLEQAPELRRTRWRLNQLAAIDWAAATREGELAEWMELRPRLP